MLGTAPGTQHMPPTGPRTLRGRHHPVRSAGNEAEIREGEKYCTAEQTQSQDRNSGPSAKPGRGTRFRPSLSSDRTSAAGLLGTVPRAKPATGTLAIAWRPSPETGLPQGAVRSALSKETLMRTAEHTFSSLAAGMWNKLE